jgi:hypothetical protein
MSEWDSIEGVAGWRDKLAQLLDEAKRAVKNQDRDARFGVAERLNEFIAMSRPQTPEIQRLDDLAAGSAVALMQQTIDEQLAALTARSAELAKLTKELNSQAATAAASAESIRLTRVREVVSTLTRSVEALNEFRAALDAHDPATLGASVEDLLGRIQDLRNAIELGAAPAARSARTVPRSARSPRTSKPAPRRRTKPASR